MPSIKQYSPCEINQYELSSRLLSLTENTNYTLTQINGQRIFKKAPHAWTGPEPSRDCEVFIGRLPHDCFEDTLVPLFQRAGELFEFRLMINFSGWNRGYAFAMYTNESGAKRAITMYNNYSIRPSWQLGVCHSINNCRIFISRIPVTTSSVEIVRLMYALTEEVKEVRIRRINGGCAAIVEYKSHRGAAMARKTLVSAAAAVLGNGARPAVDWSLPQSPHLMKQYREIGHCTPEGGVQIHNLVDEPTSAPSASYSLERCSRARRLHMIIEAQRRSTSRVTTRPVFDPRPDLQPQAMLSSRAGAGGSQPQTPPNYAPADGWFRSMANSSSNSMASSNECDALNPWGFWEEDAIAPETPEYNPWTSPHPLRDPRHQPQ